MGYRLQMSAEIHDWLAGLRDSDPPAALLAGQALTALAEEGGGLGPPLVISPPDRPGPEELIEEAWDQDTGRDGTEGEDPGPPVAGAAARLRDITGQVERETGQQAPAEAEGLHDLRPGAPGDSDIRILFAVEPPGTALLIAVLEGRDAVREHYRDAVALSAEVLQRVRAGQDPEAVTHAFGDPRSFLDEFFPGRADEVSQGAAALVAANRPRPLAEQRIQLGLTQAQVAGRMGVRQERVVAIERAGPAAIQVRTLARYVEALGGRLDIIADFGGERILLADQPARRAGRMSSE